MSKYRVGGKSKNDNRVDSFIWHLGVELLKIICLYISIDYNFFFQPYISDDELRDSQDQGCVEGCEAYYTRNFFVTQCVLASTENVGGDVLFVGHASTLDACAQQLIGN